MIRIYISESDAGLRDAYLELSEGSELSFTKTNNKWTDEDLVQERTTEFDLPNTPHNMSVMQLAHILDGSGAVMRRKLKARLDMGVMDVEGDLSFTNYNNESGTYSCVFYIRSEVFIPAGFEDLTLADCLRDAPEAYVDTSDYEVVDMNHLVYRGAGDVPNDPLVWECIGYLNNHTVANYPASTNNIIRYLPSFSVEALLRIINAHAVGFTVSLGVSGYLRYLPNTLNTFKNHCYSVYTKLSFNNSGNYPVFMGAVGIKPAGWEINSNMSALGWDPQTDFFLKQADCETIINLRDISYHPYYQDFVYVLVDCDITFPDDLPTNIFMKKHFVNVEQDATGTWDVYSQSSSRQAFYGDYYFLLSDSNLVFGTPLAGRTVSLKAGSRFTLCSNQCWGEIKVPRQWGSNGNYWACGLPSDVFWDRTNDYSLTYSYYWRYGVFSGSVCTRGWGWLVDKMRDNPSITALTCRLKVVAKEQTTFETANNTLENKQPYVPLGANVPDMTLLDFMRLCARLTGTRLSFYYSGGYPSFYLDPLTIIDADTEYLDLSCQLLQISSTERTFSDFAQHNIVKLRQAPLVQPPEKGWSQALRSDWEVDYEVDNANLDEEPNMLAEYEETAGEKVEASSFDDFDRVCVTYKGLSTSDMKDYGAVIAETTRVALDAPYMRFFVLPFNNNMRRLCLSSTKVVADFKMTFLQYYSLRDGTIILFNDHRWIWLEADWSGGVCTMTLQKVWN